MRPPIQRAQREGQPQASVQAPQTAASTPQASESFPKNTRAGTTSIRKHAESSIPCSHKLPPAGSASSIPSPHSHPPPHSAKGLAEAEACGSALASLVEPPVGDIPRGTDCRPSAPPLVSLSALTAVRHAAEDYPSAVPTGFVSQLEGFDKGRPCRASGLWPRANPGFGRPCRATHPGL